MHPTPAVRLYCMSLRALGSHPVLSRCVAKPRVLLMAGKPVIEKVETIDLTLIDEEVEEDPEWQKSRIMAQAKAVLDQRERAQPTPEQFGSLEAPVQGPSEGLGSQNATKRLKGDGAQPGDPTQDPQPAGFIAPAVAPMNDLLRVLHQERQARLNQQGPGSAGQPQHGAAATGSGGGQNAANQSTGKRKAAEGAGASSRQREHSGAPSLTILSFNLWFDPSALRERMKGLGTLLLQEQPDIVLFQEVTEDTMKCWAMDNEWMLQHYKWSRPPAASYFTLLGFKPGRLTCVEAMNRFDFTNSEMGRDVLSVALSVTGSPPGTPPLLVATSHLESPMPGFKYTQCREEQQRLGARHLEEHAAAISRNKLAGQELDIVWGGDMNWITEHAFEPRLPAGWVDVWPHVHGEAKPGHTWDTRNNPMLAHKSYKPGRLDRVFARLGTWQVSSLELVGTEALPGLTISMSERRKNLPVTISDHFGLLLKLVCPVAPGHRLGSS